MFRSNPNQIIDELISLIDNKKSRMSLKEASDLLSKKGFDLGSNPQETVKALVSLTNSEVLDLRPGVGGGIGRPSMFKKPNVKETGLVALMRQALAQGQSVEQVKAKLEELASESDSD